MNISTLTHSTRLLLTLNTVAILFSNWSGTLFIAVLAYRTRQCIRMRFRWSVSQIFWQYNLLQSSPEWTSSSAIADRPCCRVAQFWPNV